jgi:4-amino-4-deoxy-L-arabinose transferase-like glycosyltransferase
VIPYFLTILLQVPLNNYVIALIARFASAIVAALSTIVVYQIGRALFSRKAALVTAIIFAFGTTTWAISSQAPWQHGMVELLLALMLLVIVRNETKESGFHLILLGICSGLLAVTRYPDAILLIPIIYYVIRFYRKKAHFYVIPAIISAVPFVMYNFLVFGSLFGGTEKAATLLGISSAIGVQFIRLLLAPNSGFFVFSPVLLMGLWGYLYTKEITNKNIRELLVLYGPTLFLNILIYSSYSGGVGAQFGPRWLTGLLPVYILYVGLFLHYGLRIFRGWERSLVFTGFALLTLISIGIQIIGAFYFPFLTDIGMDENRVWNASDSLILRSYHDGSTQMITIAVNSIPPLPPLLNVNVRNGVVYPIASNI